MSITQSRLKQIIKEELERATEGYSSWGRGGRGSRWPDTTGYRGRYNDTPWYRQGGSGRMSDAEARERGGRGYDEPDERDMGPARRGGTVHSTVTIYTDPVMAADPFLAKQGTLGARLDSAAQVFLDQVGYDGMAGKFVLGKNPETGFNDVGARWVLSKSPEGFTFTTGGTVGNGPTPSAALRDAAQQGFEGSDVVLDQLGGSGSLATISGGTEPLDEARWNKLAGIIKD